MDGLWWKTLLKWMIWGYPYFWKHPSQIGSFPQEVGVKIWMKPLSLGSRVLRNVPFVRSSLGTSGTSLRDFGVPVHQKSYEEWCAILGGVNHEIWDAASCIVVKDLLSCTPLNITKWGYIVIFNNCYHFQVLGVMKGDISSQTMCVFFIHGFYIVGEITVKEIGHGWWLLDACEVLWCLVQ